MVGIKNADSRASCAASKVQRFLKRPQTAQNWGLSVLMLEQQFYVKCIGPFNSYKSIDLKKLRLPLFKRYCTNENGFFLFIKTDIHI